MRAGGAAVALIALAACGDLSTPPELTHPQILAVRAESPAIPAGASTALSVVVAGPEGIVAPDETIWRVVRADQDTAPVGTIDVAAEPPVYVAPAEVAGLAIATVEVVARMASGEKLVALKAIGVGAPMPTENPTIIELRVDGAAIGEGEVVRLAPGAIARLDAVVVPEPGEDASFAWYATAGTIDLYRRAPTELEAADEPREGVLILVYRDGRGGVDLRAVQLIIDD